jgi:hypothetical protein
MGAAHIVLGLLYPRWLQMTYHAAGGGCRTRLGLSAKFVVEALRRLDWTWAPRWEIGPFAHTCASVVGILADPSVVGRGCSPVSSNKARGYCCRTPGGYRAPLQPRRAAGGLALRVRGRACARRPQALPRPATALIIYTYVGNILCHTNKAESEVQPCTNSFHWNGCCKQLIHQLPSLEEYYIASVTKRSKPSSALDLRTPQSK